MFRASRALFKFRVGFLGLRGLYRALYGLGLLGIY